MQMAGRFKQAGILNETPAPPASGGDAREARPADAEPRPGRTDAKLAAGKSPYDSLEQEMASLLGLPTRKLEITSLW
jgi:hypothetical protein